MKNFLSVIRNHDTLTNTAKDALSVFEIFTSKCVKGLHTKKHFLCDEAQNSRIRRNCQNVRL